jgi:hypothetical protein
MRGLKLHRYLEDNEPVCGMNRNVFRIYRLRITSECAKRRATCCTYLDHLPFYLVLRLQTPLRALADIAHDQVLGGLM